MTPHTHRPLFLLLVDDDTETRELLAELLNGDGFTVCQASDGAEALRLLLGGLRPDLVLSDVNMPVMDGVELANALATHPELSPMPMLLLTAGVPPARAFPVVQVVTKPFRYENLLRIVQQLSAYGWQPPACKIAPAAFAAC